MNSKLRIFIICIGVAALLWFFNHMNREYTVRVYFNINYQGLNFKLDDNVMSEIDAEISGTGFSLLRYKRKSPQTIILQSKDFSYTKHNDSIYMKIIPEKIRNKIIEILPASVQLESVQHDMFVLSYAEIISKDVPVFAKFAISNTEKCTQCEPYKIKPEKINISGPPSILNKIDSAYTYPIRITNCDTFRQNVKVQIPKQIKSSTNFVNVFAVFCKENRIEKLLPYSIEHHGKNYSGNVKVVLSASENDLDKKINIGLKSEIIDNQIIFNIINQEGCKILKFSPKSIPIEI